MKQFKPILFYLLSSFVFRIFLVVVHLNIASALLYDRNIMIKISTDNVVLPVLNGANNLTTTIRSQWGGLCLDVPDFDRSPKNDDRLQVFQCHGGSNQQFSLLSDGTIRTPQWGNLCLDVPDFGRPPKNGDRLQVFECNGGSNQQFSWLSDGTIRTPQWGNLCLDVPDFGRPPKNGDFIQVFQCNGGSNQRWSVNR
jgi:hypothetical protein